MTCKYPITSRSYKFCIGCSDIGCCEDGSLKPETRKKLEELGYKVETGTQYNEPYYSISWKE